MRKKIDLMAMVLLLLLPFGAMAQVVVSGTVTDAANAPLTGVSVRLRNSPAAAVTDAAGRFSLSVPSASGTLEFTYVGFATQTVALSPGVTTYTVKLQEAEGRLNEVVITGLASSVKRSNLGNAVASVSAKELTGTTVQPTMDAALYGKFTGSNISANSGAPGGGISLKLRGITSLVANSQPLFIVDGVYYDNSSINAGLNSVSKAAGQGSTNFQDNPSNRIADLDPDDIDRIEILKGASAAAIYGSRAAAGVVLITTKRGRTGKPRIELAQSIGAQWQLKKLGQRDWTEEKVNASIGPNAVPLFRAANGKVYNYEEELYGNTGTMSNTRISVSGGNENTKYYTGFTYKSDEGIVKRTGYRKSSFRLNLDQKITSFIDGSFNANYVSSRADRGYFNNDNTSTTLGVSFVSTPSFINLYPDANGNYPDNPLAPSNFLQTRDLVTNRENVDRILLGGTATVRILNGSKHNLRFIARGGLDQYTLNTIALFPRELQFEKNGNGTNGASINGTTISKGKNLSAFLVDNVDVSKLNFRTQVGLTAEDLDQNNVVNTATQMIGSQSNVNQAGSIKADQAVLKQNDRGFFVQEEVNYQDKLIATLGLRGDKSSRNGNANKLYYYPKASLALNVHRFFSLNTGAFSQLKLRSAYGQSGNFAPFGAIYLSLPPVIFNNTAGSVVDLTRGNPALEPERQKEWELGLDAGFFNDRASLEFTYYNKTVEDLLLKVVVPLSSGYTDAWRNVAAIENKGVEIALNATPVVSRDLHWNFTANFWKNTAKVTRLDVPAFNTGAFGATLGTYRVELGKSPTQIVGIGTADDKIDPVTKLAVYGNGEPDFNLSSYNDVFYKSFELSFLVHWKKGGNNINLTTLLSDIFGTSPDYDKKSLDPSGQKTNGEYRLAALGSTARPWVEDATYFRLREIGLSYRLPKSLFRNAADVRVGVSGRNLINVFKYNSYDPEVSNFGSNAISSNVEVTPFPSAKSVHFTVNLTF
ncbi:SusC/RagA family TonB-linked outer membrane protein [Flavisolibacter nicotianae]|uniref:SusC/RagA family TonB-linked outer membrane protein n=1 Tax=Flavisolibacter nicotianae TaxID=2364882 RepID=UPI000EAFE2C1|nr:SusC/RagA family TonB-linked outer membrane protein [Flavisolibacter nicotianae]